jgi:ABC-type xylose transport system permease subunit
MAQPEKTYQFFFICIILVVSLIFGAVGALIGYLVNYETIPSILIGLCWGAIFLMVWMGRD